MSDKCFVDTHILVYAHDRSAGVKHQRAQMLLEQLWDSGQGVLSTIHQKGCATARVVTSAEESPETNTSRSYSLWPWKKK